MPVSCVNNKCTASDLAEVAGDEQLPTLDAASYVSGVLPIPEGSTFLMSRMAENHDIIALDFTDDSSLKDTLDRISTFVEENGKRHVPSLEEMSRLPAGEGDDFRMGDIADFYNACTIQGRQLSAGEHALLEKLLNTGLLNTTKNGTCSATSSAALIGMSRDNEVLHKKAIFVHEYSHALYFVDSDFRSKVSKAWDSLKPDEKRFLRGAMMASGYYASGEQGLIETELQAHAIGAIYSGDGLVNLFTYSDKNCEAGKRPTQACRDFWSYRGKIRDLLHAVHFKFIDISRCDIPLFEGWKLDNGLIHSEEIASCHEVTGEQAAVILPGGGSISMKALMETIATVIPPKDECDFVDYSIISHFAPDPTIRFCLFMDDLQKEFDRRHKHK